MKRHIILGLLSTCLFAGAAQADAGHHHGDAHAAIGRPGKPGDASRTVQVDMTDTMRFTPARIDVRRNSARPARSILPVCSRGILKLAWPAR